MAAIPFDTRNRIRGGLITVLLEGLIGYGLVLGFSVDMPARLNEQLKIFDIGEPPPPPLVKPPTPELVESRKPRGAASPRNLNAKPSEIVAPRPLRPPGPPPVAAAPVAGPGAAATAGASNLPGPGPGAGGQGSGRGSGGAGEGEGGDTQTPPIWRSGRIKDSDYPQAARDVGAEGTLSVSYVVGTNGRVSNCRVTRSSGNAALDETTCRLFEQRLRFEPSRDAERRPVAVEAGDENSWSFRRDE